MQRQFVIDFRHCEAYECGAILVALVAHPEASATDQLLDDLQGALCHLHLKAQAEIDPAWAEQPQQIKPLYAFLEPKRVDRALRQLKRRLRDRMVAARMGIAFLKEVDTGQVPPLPKSVERLSLNALSALVLDDLGATDELNVETRVWRPSLPVIHLACAVATTMDQIHRAGHGDMHLGHLLSNADLIRGILETAETYRDMFYRSKRLSIGPDVLIQLITNG